jgi:phospholipase/lecithinase/hemolysin
MSVFFSRLGLALGTVVLALGTPLLGGCGGSVSRVEPFVPQAIAAFGDESSLILPIANGEAGGRKYGVNALDTTVTPSVLSCAQYPVWTQQVAASFGFAFAECNPSALPTTQTYMGAAAGAKAADVAAQIAAFQSSGHTITSKTLMLVMAGTNDIVQAYADCAAGTISPAQAVAQVWTAGQQLSNAINSIANANGRTVFVTVPDPLLSPRGVTLRADPANCVEAVRAVVRPNLKDANSCAGNGLACTFNAALRTTVVNDGYRIALVTGDERMVSVIGTPPNFGLIDTVTPICTTALPGCDSTTLVTRTDGLAATAANYLWADDLWPGYPFQAQIASLAFTRATSNPF